MQKIILKPKEERRLLRGHLWVYRNEIVTKLDGIEDGETVDVAADNGRFIGRGFYQPEGGIAIRLVTHREEPLDEALFARRIEQARAFREGLYPGETVYRWVYGESDRLPGFIADRYGAVVSVQTQSPFYTRNAKAISEAFLSANGIEGVLFRRGGEAVIFGEVPDKVECETGGIAFAFEPNLAQKTGLFLDQRENWAELKPFLDGAKVLDLYCYTGAWSLYAAQHGAKQVLGIDSSEAAIAQATENAERNGLTDRCTFTKMDAQEALAQKSGYDIVLLDPPALAKKRKQTSKALGLYRALNRDAMKALKPGGILIASSCSQPVTREDFIETLKRAATSAQRSVQLLALNGPAKDHPVMLSMPETAYLKCAVLRVL